MTERDTIRAALHHIPAHDRELWLRMGMAVKSEPPITSDGGITFGTLSAGLSLAAVDAYLGAQGGGEA